MEPSATPEDVLSLGRRIACEIGAQDDRNTLGRWLAHHLAELIGAAETDIAAADRAVDTILRIWAQREDLPGRAYPPNRLSEAIQVLGRLSPDANPWRAPRPTTDAEILGDVVDGLNRLVLIGVVLQLDPEDRRAHTEEELSLLGSEERELVETISGVLEHLRAPPRPTLSRIVIRRITAEDGTPLPDEVDADDISDALPDESGDLTGKAVLRVATIVLSQVRKGLDDYEAWLVQKAAAEMTSGGSEAREPEADD